MMLVREHAHVLEGRLDEKRKGSTLSLLPKPAQEKREKSRDVFVEEVDCDRGGARADHRGRKREEKEGSPGQARKKTRKGATVRSTCE